MGAGELLSTAVNSLCLLLRALREPGASETASKLEVFGLALSATFFHWSLRCDS